MIDPHELRKGSLVFVEGHRENVFKVTEIKTAHAVVMGGPIFHARYDELIPIHLTPEWAINLDFGKITEGYVKGLLIMQYTNFPIPEGCENKNYWVVAELDKIDNNGHLLQKVNLRYVHQLQNLWFVLNGEELRYQKKYNINNYL
jgi:hypothetical protein